MTYPDLPVNPGQPTAPEQYTLSNLMPQPGTAPVADSAPTSPGAATNRTAAFVALGAGLAVILGSFLPWGSITAPIVGTYTVSGTDGSDGWITAAAGALIALYAGVSLRRPLPNLLAPLAALVGLGVSGLAIWKIVDLQSKVADMKAEMAAEGDEFGIAAAMADVVQVRVGAGLWLLVVAGLAAVVGSALMTLKRTRSGT